MAIRTVPIAQITISPKRQRRVFDEGKHVELCDSIQNEAIGLMHPIVLRSEGDKYVLVAGERRLRAFIDSHELGVDTFHAGHRVPPGQVPYTDLGEMDPLDAWEAELEENIRRVDLTWQERAAATQELMELRTKQAEKKGEAPPTVRNIAEEITGRGDGSYHAHTRAELIAARHLDDPDVKAAPNLERAVKVIKKKEEAKRHEQLAAVVGTTYSASSHSLVNTPCEDWFRTAPAAHFDVVLTDPPYGMGADTFGDSDGKAEGAHGYEDGPEVVEQLLAWLPEELFRVTKQQAHLYLFCDLQWFYAWTNRLAQAGWNVFRTPIIWHKPNGYRAPWPDKGPQRRYETILFAIKGDKLVKKMGGDVLTYSADENLGHAAQKPVALYHDLLCRSVQPGDNVLDCFAGTGPILPAAHQLKCYATAVEKAPAAYGIAVKRLQGLK